jgi:hypothetical protein
VTASGNTCTLLKVKTSVWLVGGSQGYLTGTLTLVNSGIRDIRFDVVKATLGSSASPSNNADLPVSCPSPFIPGAVQHGCEQHRPSPSVYDPKWQDTARRTNFQSQGPNSSGCIKGRARSLLKTSTPPTGSNSTFPPRADPTRTGKASAHGNSSSLATQSMLMPSSLVCIVTGVAPSQALGQTIQATLYLADGSVCTGRASQVLPGPPKSSRSG